jgi:hypothetical protein
MDSNADSSGPPLLKCGIVLRTGEDECEVLIAGQAVLVRYAAQFPTPRTERVSPGHLVAVASTPDRRDTVVWRWYDAVVLGAEAESVRLWEPAHGEVDARARHWSRPAHTVGTRAYLSAGLPGADWWVAGTAVSVAEDAEVELTEVAQLYTDHELWDAAFGE